MPDVFPKFELPPGCVHASAYTAEDVARLGVPRGLVPHPPAGPAGPPADRAGQIDALQARLESLRDEPAEPGLGLGPRTRFRFQSHGEAREIDPPSNLMRDPAHSRRAGAVRKQRPRRRALRWTILGLVAAAALTGGYWLGRPPAAASGVDEAANQPATTRQAWTPADREKLPAILAAENSIRPREAGELVARLAAERPRLGGLALLRARSSIAASLHADAEVNLERARAGGREDAVEIEFLRALNFGRQRKLDEMRSCLGDAIALDPLRAEFHFARAEVDRRQGRPNEALESYARALARARTGRLPDAETIQFRRRLLLIENGRGGEIDAGEYQAQLAKPAPPGDWLLTAAAVALQRQDPAEAARWMQRARAAMPAADYFERVDDYFFRVHADRPELKALFPSKAARAQRLEGTRPALVDP